MELMGHHVTRVDTGRAVLDAIRIHADVDLVVMDHLLQGMSGLETLRALRQSGSKLPVVMYTSVYRIRGEVEALDAILVTKPDPLVPVIEEIERTLDRP